MKIRDTSPVYGPIRGSGRVGFPLIQREDGALTLDANGSLQELGIEDKLQFQR